MKKLLAVFIAMLAMILTGQDVYRLNDSTFVYQCMAATDSTSGLNLIGLPLETSWTMASDIDPDGTNIDAVTRWNSELGERGGWQTAAYHPAIGWCRDFPLNTGESYFLNTVNDFDLEVTGDSTAVHYDLKKSFSCLLVHPLSKADITTAGGIGSDIGIDICSSISRWNRDTGSWNSTSYNIILGWLGNFNSVPGKPLNVYAKLDGSWDAKEDTEKVIFGRGPKMIFFHLQRDTGEEFLPMHMEEGMIKSFVVRINDDFEFYFTPDDVDCGYDIINGYSVAYINLANSKSKAWNYGDELHFYITWCINDYEKSKDGKCFISEYNCVADSTNSPLFFGFESVMQGSGQPLRVHPSMYVETLSQAPEIVMIDSSHYKLQWVPDPHCHAIYSSDNPSYGSFDLYDWAPLGITSIGIPLSEKQFYYITVIPPWDYPWDKEGVK